MKSQYVHVLSPKSALYWSISFLNQRKYFFAIGWNILLKRSWRLTVAAGVRIFTKPGYNMLELKRLTSPSSYPCWWGYFASVSVFHIKVLICISGKCNTDAYSEPSWTSKMELLASGSIKKLFFDLSKISIVLTFISFWYFLQYISGHIQKQTLHSWQKALKSFFGSNFFILFII